MGKTIVGVLAAAAFGLPYPVLAAQAAASFPYPVLSPADREVNARAAWSASTAMFEARYENLLQLEQAAVVQLLADTGRLRASTQGSAIVPADRQALLAATKAALDRLDSALAAMDAEPKPLPPPNATASGADYLIARERRVLGFAVAVHDQVARDIPKLKAIYDAFDVGSRNEHPSQTDVHRLTARILTITAQISDVSISNKIAESRAIRNDAFADRLAVMDEFSMITSDLSRNLDRDHPLTAADRREVSDLIRARARRIADLADDLVRHSQDAVARAPASIRGQVESGLAIDREVAANDRTMATLIRSLADKVDDPEISSTDVFKDLDPIGALQRRNVELERSRGFRKSAPPQPTPSERQR